MDSNKWIRENSILSIVIGIVLITLFIYLLFGRSAQKVVTTSDSRESSFFQGSNLISEASPEVVNGLPLAEPPAATANTNSSEQVIEWCVLIDGVNHIPDFIGQGEDNKIGGTNWHSLGNDDPKNPYGTVYEDGKLIFFVKKTYLDQHRLTINNPQVKSNYIGWSRTGTMDWVNFAGEPALVFIAQ